MQIQSSVYIHLHIRRMHMHTIVHVHIFVTSTHQYTYIRYVSWVLHGPTFMHTSTCWDQEFSWFPGCMSPHCGQTTGATRCGGPGAWRVAVFWAREITVCEISRSHMLHVWCIYIWVILLVNVIYHAWRIWWCFLPITNDRGIKDGNIQKWWHTTASLRLFHRWWTIVLRMFRYW